MFQTYHDAERLKGSEKFGLAIANLIRQAKVISDQIGYLNAAGFIVIYGQWDFNFLPGKTRLKGAAPHATLQGAIEKMVV